MAYKMEDRHVQLVVDGEGDVVLARFDKQDGGEPAEVHVLWPKCTRNEKPLRIVRLTYRFRVSEKAAS